MQEILVKIYVNLSWHLIWLFALLEGFTVPLVPLLSESGPRVDSAPVTATVGARSAAFAVSVLVDSACGAVIGFAGSLMICFVLNRLAFRRMKLCLDDSHVVRITRPFIAGGWGGVLLAMIFCIHQFIAGLAVFPLVLDLVLLGSLAAAGGVIVTGSIYSRVVKSWPVVGIKLLTAQRMFLLRKFPVGAFAMLVGIYEGLSVPIFHVWQIVPQYHVFTALLAGILGGVLCSSIVVALAHRNAINRRLWLEFSTATKIHCN